MMTFIRFFSLDELVKIFFRALNIGDGQVLRRITRPYLVYGRKTIVRPSTCRSICSLVSSKANNFWVWLKWCQISTRKTHSNIGGKGANGSDPSKSNGSTSRTSKTSNLITSESKISLLKLFYFGLKKATKTQLPSSLTAPNSATNRASR